MEDSLDKRGNEMNVYLRQFPRRPRLAPSAFPSVLLEYQILGPPSRVAGSKVLRTESIIAFS